MNPIQKIAATLRERAKTCWHIEWTKQDKEMADALDALAEAPECKRCTGTRTIVVRGFDTMAEFGPCPDCAPPQPEPATMIETIPVDETHELRKIDGFWQLFTVREGSWVRSLNGYECEFVDCAIRSAALQTAARLAAPQRPTVSLNDILAATDRSVSVGESIRRLRALGIKVE